MKPLRAFGPWFYAHLALPGAGALAKNPEVWCEGTDQQSRKDEMEASKRESGSTVR
jgi:hypothetical protein